jgi:hypothetical protein
MITRQLTRAGGLYCEVDSKGSRSTRAVDVGNPYSHNSGPYLALVELQYAAEYMVARNHLDAKRAFLNGQMTEKAQVKVWLQAADAENTPTGLDLYGLTQAALAWYEE